MKNAMKPSPDSLDDRLRRALGPERPDPDAFAQGLARRMERERERLESHRARWRRAPGVLQAAAGFLPPTIVPYAVQSLGGGLKSLSWKAVPGLVALPAVSLSMLVLTFLGALGTLRSKELGDPNDTTGALVLLAWWRRNWITALAVLAVLVTLVAQQHSEAAIALIMVSMATCSLLFAQFSRAGLADRQAVTSTAANILRDLGLLWFVLTDLLVVPAPLDRVLGPTVLLAASVVSAFVGHRWTPRRVWRSLRAWAQVRAPNRIASVCLQGLAFALAFVAIGLAGTVLHEGWQELGRLEISEERTRTFLEHGAPADPIGANWTEFQDVVGLRSAGELTRLDLSAWRDLSTDRKPNRTLQARLGWRGMPETITGDAWLDRASLREEAVLYSQLHAGELDAVQRDRAAAGLLRTHLDGAEDRELELEAGLRIVHLVEALGATSKLDERRDRFLDLLERTYVPLAAGLAVWSDQPDHLRSSPERIDQHARDPDNFAAVALAERFGLPDGIELQSVRRTLDSYRSFGSPWSVGFSEASAAALLHLERMGATPPGGWDWLVQHRVLLGACLLALFAILAVLRAPEREQLDARPER